MIEWINVKEIASQYKEALKTALEGANINSNLWVFSSGENSASEAYIRGKEKDCKEIGIPFNHIKVSSKNVNNTLNLIDTLQKDENNKIIIQSPFENKQIERLLMNKINFSSDVDYLSDMSIGRMYSEGDRYPATAFGLKLLLNHFDITDLSGKRAAVVGRSLLAGAPCAKVLQDMGATVTIIHSKSKNYKDILQSANIVILATGQEGMFTEDDFSNNTMIIDIGISEGSDGKLHGDFKLKDENCDKNLIITPVPGGMGLMTRVGLLFNILGIGY